MSSLHFTRAAPTLSNNSLAANEYSNSTLVSLESSALLLPLQETQSLPAANYCSSRPRTPCTGPRTHVYAIDRASTKLKIPLSAVEPTQALEDDGLVPGLCRLYFAGRCRQGAHCYQVHADPGTVEELRLEAQRQPSCCVEHGVKSLLEGYPIGLKVTIEPRKHRNRPPGERDETNGPSGDSSSNSNGYSNNIAQEDDNSASRGVLLSILSFSPTAFLWRAYQEDGSAHLVVPRGKVCRMHRQGLCRFGDECNFLHVCRQIPLDLTDEDSVPRRRPSVATLASPPAARQWESRSSGSLPSYQGSKGSDSHFVQPRLHTPRQYAFAACETGGQAAGRAPSSPQDGGSPGLGHLGARATRCASQDTTTSPVDAGVKRGAKAANNWHAQAMSLH